MRRHLAAVLVLAAGLALLGPSAQAAERRSAVMLLNSLPVAPEHPSGYQRSAFADWEDMDGSGCDSRQDVLIAERLAGRVEGCRVVGGRWLSVYDGVITSNPSSLDIDHRVPLAEAWASGAWRWTSSTRDRYANDVGYPGSLIAVSASSNRSKGDREPGEWMPPARSQRCDYIKQWIGVKYRWRLAVDASEKSYLGSQLRRCDPLMVVPASAAVRAR